MVLQQQIKQEDGLKMKFANYHYTGKHINNLGDHIQILTVDYLYRDMGVCADDIVYIDKDALQHYDGEPVFLPVSMPLIDYKEHGIAGMFSPKITPIFMGLTMAKDELLPEEIAYLMMHEPIGCRDERTFDTLTNAGVRAYLSGCLTVALPTRNENSEKQRTIFIIDPTVGVKRYIPQIISEDAVSSTHLYYEKINNPTLMAEERFNRYQNEARLVITSLLHCSVPCMAMGIPVVLAKDVVSYRFGWLEALLQIYTPPEYASINWNPLPVALESHKKLVKTLFNKRMNRQDATSEISCIHDFYMARNRCDYIVDAFIEIQRFIDSTWLEYSTAYQYAVWGLTQMAYMTVSYISKRYPKAKLAHVYDVQVGLTFMDMLTLHPDDISLYTNETVIVTTVGATEYAKKLFNEINKPEHMYMVLEVIK